LSPPDFPFWRYEGSKVQLSYLLPKNWVGRSPPYFAQGIIGMTPKNPENFVKVLPPVSEIFGILNFTKVSYTLITESLYSNEYSFTFIYIH